MKLIVADHSLELPPVGSIVFSLVAPKAPWYVCNGDVVDAPILAALCNSPNPYTLPNLIGYHIVGDTTGIGDVVGQSSYLLTDVPTHNHSLDIFNGVIDNLMPSLKTSTSTKIGTLITLDTQPSGTQTPSQIPIDPSFITLIPIIYAV